jgi:alpha-ketoglutarate-dependent taurine dioxygenase
MIACDARAREVENYFRAQTAQTAQEWTSFDQVLVVDNRRALHARSAVAQDDLARELTRIAFRAGAVQ